MSVVYDYNGLKKYLMKREHVPGKILNSPKSSSIKVIFDLISPKSVQNNII